ncbi:MAG: hypothetical protein HPY74_02850 [Firmicutes bacterium]|nr:hypothetical protein [Bacillota bacterium]
MAKATVSQRKRHKNGEFNLHKNEAAQIPKKVSRAATLKEKNTLFK